MNDEGALLRPILESPADDAARLVYADWLEEHDEPERAEFIRTQIEKALCSDPSHPRHADGGYRARLTARANLLWKQHRGRWLPWARTELLAYPSRGFVARVACKTEWFLGHAAELFSREPVVEVRLSDRKPEYRYARYHWQLTGRPDDLPRRPALLPHPLASLLAGPPGDGYPSEQAAFQDLSQACVTLGRDLAGLSLIPERPEA